MEIMLSVECSEETAEFVQEWFTDFARNTRSGLSELEMDGEILLTSSEGVYEKH